MPHATEGELHAYVDGALTAIDADAVERLNVHLRTCADCRARLEEARSLRDESSALLDVALGGRVEPPPFEDLLEVAAGRPPSVADTAGRRPGRARRLERFAWAASIVIALGAGWMARAVVRESGTGPLAPGRAQRVADVDALESNIGADRSNEAGDEPAASRQRAEELLRETAEEDAARDAGRRSQVENAAIPSAAGEAGAAAFRGPASTPTAERRLDLAQTEAEAAQQAKPAAADARDTAEREALAAAGIAAQADAAPGAPAREPSVAGSPLAERRAADPEPADAAASTRPFTDLDDIRFADPSLDGLVWRTVERSVAEAASGGTVESIPGLDILEYAIADRAGAPFTRVRQRLPGGDTLEIVDLGSAEQARDELADRKEEPEAARGAVVLDAPAETRARPAVLAYLWAELNGRRIRVSAPVAPDSLRVLVSRVR